jgi:predicted neuraminidase
MLLDAAQRPAPLPAAAAHWPTLTRPADLASMRVLAHGSIPMPNGVPAAHASNLLALPAGQPASLLAFWFAGTRESAPDVQIAMSWFDCERQRWSDAQLVIERHALAGALGFGVRRLGNPVAWLDARGRVHVFVVATGLGGWAAGRIAHLQQADATTIGPDLRLRVRGVLPLSWLWNISMLVRTPPLPLQDGGMVLPVYFELGSKYPLALRVDADGTMRGMTRISARGHALQPALLPLGEQQWLALMRDRRHKGFITAARTDDGGQHWQDLPDLSLHNPNSAVAALSLNPHTLLLAHNPLPGSRQRLDLSWSADGTQWQRLLTLAEGVEGEEYSDPALAWADDTLWVSYTHQRQSIAWQQLGWTAPPAGTTP